MSSDSPSQPPSQSTPPTTKPSQELPSSALDAARTSAASPGSAPPATTRPESETSTSGTRTTGGTFEKLADREFGHIADVAEHVYLEAVRAVGPKKPDQPSLDYVIAICQVVEDWTTEADRKEGP